MYCVRLLPNHSGMSPLKILSEFCCLYLFKSFNFLEQGILNLLVLWFHWPDSNVERGNSLSTENQVF